MKNPQDVQDEDLRWIVEQIQSALWPTGDRDHQWSPDTLDEIAGALIDAGLGPDPKA